MNLSISAYEGEDVVEEKFPKPKIKSFHLRIKTL